MTSKRKTPAPIEKLHVVTVQDEGGARVVKYVPVASAPARVRFDPASTEVAYGGYCDAPHTAGAPYKRVVSGDSACYYAAVRL